MSDEVLFKSAADALRFAFNYSHQQYDRPMMNRMMGGRNETGKGLSGLDGAAQAGMIRRELSTLPNLYRAVLIARYAPRSFPCTCGRPCCVGSSVNFEWREAVNAVASYATDMVPGGAGKFRLRRDLVFRAYGSGKTVEAIAEDCGVSERTAYTHNGALVSWLRGRPERGKRKAVPGVEQVAEHAATAVFAKAGFIGG